MIKAVDSPSLALVPASRVARWEGASRDAADGHPASAPVQLSPEAQRMVADLVSVDRRVRAHEAAHQAVGGALAGSAQFSFQVGPDGRSYAVSGEVSIDMSTVPGDPEGTVTRMRQVQHAALAPSDPSPQDQAVASAAAQLEAQARLEMLRTARTLPASTATNVDRRWNSASSAYARVAQLALAPQDLAERIHVSA